MKQKNKGIIEKKQTIQNKQVIGKGWDNRAK